MLMLYVPINRFSVVLRYFLSSTKQRIKCLAQGHNTVPPVSLELEAFLSKVLTLPMNHCAPLFIYLLILARSNSDQAREVRSSITWIQRITRIQ